MVILSVSVASAIPGTPHWFYGEVMVNGQPAPDDNVVVSVIGTDNYTTITKDGMYGDSSAFYVEDPDGNRAGSNLIFSVGGMYAGEYIFENGAFSELNFDLTTTCGDSYCLGDESCFSCAADCVCTDPLVLIVSPEVRVYDTTRIDLEVFSNQNMILWRYSLNSASEISFSPNITISVPEGDNNITVIGVNEQYQKVKKSVAFNVVLPVASCSDGVQNQDESGVDCGGVCAVCADNDDGGSSGGGGGGSSSTTTLSNRDSGIPLLIENGSVVMDVDGLPVSADGESLDRGFSSAGITGAVVGGGASSWISALLFVALAVILLVAVKKKVMRNKGPSSKKGVISGASLARKVSVLSDQKKGKKVIKKTKKTV